MSEYDVIVVGGGVVGLSTAHALASYRTRVLLLESREDVALGASFANGGLLTPAMSNPWNSPGVHRQIPEALLALDAPFKIRWHALPSLALWGTKFLRNSHPERYRQTTLASFALAHYSTELTRQSIAGLNFDFSACESGSLKIFREQSHLEAAWASTAELRRIGLAAVLLTADETVAKEPALSESASLLAGAIFFPQDIVGDARLFSQGLSQTLSERGVAIKHQCGCRRILMDAGTVTGVDTDQGAFHARDVVLCTGWEAPRLMEGLDVSLPIAPVKGYSLTIDWHDIDVGPKIPVVDDALHAAITPLSGRLRVVGTADFAGGDRTLDARRLAKLEAFLHAVLPVSAQHANMQTATAWAGQRPMSADGLPFIGESGAHRGLWINAGHGHLGWTMAMGSGKLLADMLCGGRPDIDPSPYRLRR